jgi:ankyrin repeat protein
MRAAFYRNTEAGRMLLAAGARTDIVNRVGDYALGIAVGREAYDLARDIQRAGSPVQGTYDAPLKALAENSNADAALARDLVVAVGPESAEAAEAVQLAARRGNLAALRSLLDAGARGPDKRITMNGALLAAVTESPNDAKTPADKPEIVALLLKHGADAGMRFRSLGAAAARERWIFLFFHNGAMDESLSALHLAADYGLPRTVALLIKAGAPVDMIDNEGRTPLWLAASYGSPWEDAYNLGRPERMTACAEAAKLLAAAGADPIREDREGFSPLLMGLSNPQIVSLFLKSPKVRTRVDAVTGSGWTALTHAAFHERRTEAIPLLLAAGADPGRPDGEGRLALDVALEKKNGKAAAYLMAGRSTGTGKGKPGAP